MKKLFPLLCLFIYLHPANAQNKDSIATLMQVYDYQGALLQISKINPDSLDTETLYMKATAFKALSKFPEAIACFDLLYKKDTANIKVTLELADCYKSTNNNQEPRELYEKALLLNPGNRYLMQLLAGSYFTTEQYDNAKELYLRACGQDTSVFLLKQTGLCCEKMLQDEEAIFFYKRAIYWAPDDYQPAFRLANLYKNLRDYDMGIAVADSFLKRVPDNRDVTRLCGYLHYLNKDFPKAISRFEQSLALSDTAVFVHKYLGFSYFKQNEFPKAIINLEKVFAIDSTDTELCYALGLAHDVPENIRYFRAAIYQVTPAIAMLSTVYQDLALALTKDWKYHEALAALMKARELMPSDPAILYKIGVHYDNWMDNKEMAVKYYRDFLETRSALGEEFYAVTATSVITKADYEHAGNRIHDMEAAMTSMPVCLSDTTMKNDSANNAQ
ncbi:MAG: tetratricopeptide repeat protein [Bacteroidales bacterium]|nr:tetratricopeptide repeat protein [Bacteroidales bacterium]